MISVTNECEEIKLALIYHKRILELCVNLRSSSEEIINSCVKMECRSNVTMIACLCVRMVVFLTGFLSVCSDVRCMTNLFLSICLHPIMGGFMIQLTEPEACRNR